MDYLQENGSCQPSAHYIWGFSSILLFVFCVLSVLFAAVLLALHFASMLCSRNGRSPYETNIYRDAVDLVYGLQDDCFGDTLQDMSADDIWRQCRDKHISLETSELPLSWKEEKRQSRLAATKSQANRPGGVVMNIKSWMRITVEFIKTSVLRKRAKENTQMTPLQPAGGESCSHVERTD